MVQHYSNGGGGGSSGESRKRSYSQSSEYGQGFCTDYGDQKRIRFARWEN